MDNRDEIRAMWTALENILNQLEGLGEDVRAVNDSNDFSDIMPRITGRSAQVAWDADNQIWALKTS